MGEAPRAMIEDWLKQEFCPRVRGFWYGYRFEVSPDEKDHLNPEFCRGWQEGIDLLFDERGAAANNASAK